MCGIAGYVADPPLNGRAMIEALNHRGPDMSGEYEAHLGDRTVYLGHARLSIIDLSSAGAQPMTAAHRRVTITYNGEVYNFQQLREQFLGKYQFRSRTDTEVLLYLYCELGPDFVTHLNGDFAMAILDEDERKLFLYRDRLGVKPLYVYERSGRFAFASEIKSFLAAGLPVSLSDVAVQQYLVFKYVPGNDTMHREIRRVPPGSYIEYDGLRPPIEHRYWAPRGDAALHNRPYGELREQLYDLLGDAVRSRLMSDVQVGTFFSGGLDSSIVAHYLRGEPGITHYCARKSEDDLRREGTTSDYAHADRMARTWGLSLQAVDIGRDEVNPELIGEVLHYSDDLIGDGSQIPSYLITRRAGETSRVMLSGMGADELFFGYGGHLLILLSSYADRLPASLNRRLMDRLARVDQGRGLFKAYRRWLHKFGRASRHPDARYALFGIVGDYESAAEVCTVDPDAVLGFIGRYFRDGEDPFDAMTRFDIENFLVKNLHYLDRMCMANSVEGRVPYMDHRVVEFALGLRRSHKLSAFGYSKRILRDTFAGRLPAHVLSRRKAGFGMPLRSIFSDPAKVHEVLDLEFLASFRFFDVNRIPRLVDQHVAGISDQSHLIYALLSFQEWYRVHHGGAPGFAKPARALRADAPAGEKRDRPKVLLTGKLPPPYIGPAVATRVLLKSRLREAFDVVHFNISDHRDINTLGAFDRQNVSLAIAHYRTLAALIKRHRPDLVYMPIAQTTVGYARDAVFVWIAKAHGCKVLCHLRGGWFRTWYAAASPLTRLLVRRTHGMIDGQIVLGENLRPLFQDLVPEDRIYVVPNGADYPATRIQRIAGEPLRVLFLSNFQGAKGMMHVAHAAAQVATRHTDVEYIFAGAWRDAATREAFEAFAAAHPHLDLQVLGEIRGQDKFDLLASCDIFVLPTDYKYEGHPWAIVEAMGHGLPIISTSVAAIPQSVQDGVNGFLVPTHDPTAVAQKIVALIDDPGLRVRMGAASRRLYEEHFTEAAMVERLAAAMNDVIARPARLAQPADGTVVECSNSPRT